MLNAETSTVLSDENNPDYLFQTIDTSILLLIVNGTIDSKTIAWKELCNRGLDNNGAWVGFGEKDRKRPF